jgi:WD40 repeat protein
MMRVFGELKHTIDHLAFAPDGRALLALCRLLILPNRTVGLWDPTDGRALWPGKIKPGCWAAFTPDGLYLLTADGSSAPRLLDLRTGADKPVPIRKPNLRGFWGPKFSPDGTRCLTFKMDFHLNWWAYPSWDPLETWSLDGRFDDTQHLGDDRFADVALSPDGRAVAGLAVAGVVLLEVPSGQRLWTHPLRLTAGEGFLAYHPDSRQLAVGSGTRVVILDLKERREVVELTQKTRYFLGGAFTPDGRHLLTVGNEETVKVWGTASWSVAREYAWEVGGLRRVAVSPNGMIAAAGGAGKKVVVWDLDD